MPHLVVLNTDRTTSCFAIDKDEMTIGRDPGNDVVVPYGDVSRRHARVRRMQNGLYLEDAGSANEIFVNGSPVQSCVLHDGTIFRLGQTALVLYLDVLDQIAVGRFVEGQQRVEGSTGRTIHELESLIEVAARVNSSLDLDEVLDAVLERALALTGADRGYVMLLEGGELVPRLVRNMDPGALDGDRLSFSRSFAQRVLETGQALAAADTFSLPGLSSESIIVHNIRSIMCAPLAIRGEPIGCLYVDVKRPTQHISDGALSLFGALANQASTAIHNASMAESLRRNQDSLAEANTRLEQSLKELEFLYELSRTINAGHDLGAVLGQCLSRTRRLLAAEIASLALYDPKKKSFATRMVVRGSGPNPDAESLRMVEQLAVEVASTRKAVLRSGSAATAHWLRDVVSAPLEVEETCLGSITMVNAPSEPGFAERDLSLLRSVANLAALAIEKYRAYQQRLAQERLDQEIENARKVQELLLPKKLPEVPHFEFASKIALPNRVGGDYYDFVPLADGRIAIVLADVAGHDIGAAIILAMGRNCLRTLLTVQAEQTLSPATILRKASEAIIDDTGGQRFITVFLGILDPVRMTLTYANAGGPNALFFCPGQEEVGELKAGGIPLGLFTGHSYAEETVAIDEGMLVVFFTDGLIEARAPGGDLFGTERVRKTLRARESDSCERLVEAIYGSALEFAASGKLQDDFTLVALRRR